jgi:molybdate/tungstate transport system substrate-binding protein
MYRGFSIEISSSAYATHLKFYLENSLRTANIILRQRTVAVVAAMLVIAFTIFFYSSSGQQNQMINTEAATTGGVGGGQVNVLSVGSLLSVMETKVGPAFSNLGYDYRGEGHGSIQNANMIIDGQRFADVFISVAANPINILINNNKPSLAKWYLGLASDEMVIAYNPKSPFASDFQKAKTGVMPWYHVLAKAGIKFLRTDRFLDPEGCYTVIATKLAGILYHNSSLSSSILNGERNKDEFRPEEILMT